MSAKRRAVISLQEEELDVAALVDGSVGDLPPATSQAVRVFISSTFSDMCSERNALMETAYPFLKEYCRQYNLEFQAFDLRWGIRDQSIDDHSIVEFCLKEIENCQKHSIGPSLAAFIGQKYGYRPLPPTIQSQEFDLLTEALSAMLKGHNPNCPEGNNIKDEDLRLLSAWYLRDNNIDPNVHKLQSISSILPLFKSEDNVLRDEAMKRWDEISKNILKLIRLAADSCLDKKKFDQMQRNKYFVSVTELELDLGVFQNPQPCQSCMCFFRTIKDLETQYIDHPSSTRFIDLNADKTIDTEAQMFLENLKNVQLQEVLKEPANIQSFEIEWIDKSSDPNSGEEYLKLFCDAFVNTMKHLIDSSLRLTQVATYDVNILDIIQHVRTAQLKGKDCRGRVEVLNKLRAYLKGRHTGQPLVIHGESGCGKSAIMAKAFLECQRWFPVDGSVSPVVIVRFFGTTTLSCDIRLALSCICWQISMAYTGGMIGIPGDYTKLVVHFSDMLRLSSSKRPLILLLDSLDQLSAFHRAHSLAWLPQSLPPHVYVLLTTLTDHNILTSLLQRLPCKQNFLSIPSFESSFSVEIIRDWLSDNNRSLTSKQFDVVKKAFLNNPVPLYTVLVCREIGRWSSYNNSYTLAPTCQAIISSLFERIENYYGFILVKHTLSFITASKNGLSRVELEDILSLDDVVLGDVFQHWVPPVLRIPPLLLCRIRDELSNYLVEKEANGTPVIYWYHNQFIKVAMERYLSDTIFSRYVHSLMGHYFLGTWSGGKKKPLDAMVLVNAFEEQKFVIGARSKVLQRDADRMVARQPLYFDQIDSSVSVSSSHNLRKLAELPHHLIRAKMFFYLRNHVLFNYDWIHAKMVATSIHDLLADYDEAAEADISFSEDPELQLLRAALRVGGLKLNEHPQSLGFELLGRLMNYYDEHKRLAQGFPGGGRSISSSDLPSSPDSNRKLGDSSALDYGSVLHTQCSFLEATNDVNRRRVKTFRHSDLLSLLQQCDNRSIQHSALLPVHQCFEPPDMMLLHVLDGHSGQPTGIVYLPTTSELVTVSKKEILFWDLNSCGAMTRRIVIPELSDARPGSAGSKLAATKNMGINHILVNRSYSKLVISNTAVDSPALVYDILTGNLERKCGSKQANSSRSFLAGDHVFCQQNAFLDIRTGDQLAEMSDFVKPKNFSTCAMSPDASVLVIGEENSLKVFEFNSHKLICQTSVKSVPSIIVVGHNNSNVYVGYTKTCLFDVCTIVRSKWSPSLKSQSLFNFKKKLPVSEVDKHKNLSVNEITDIVLPAEDVAEDGDEEIAHQVLLNINRITLILVSDTDEDKWVLMKTDFLKGGSSSPKHLPYERASYKVQMDFLIGRPAFSGNGEFVLAGIGNRLCIWSRETGEVLRAVPFHTHSKFHLTRAEKHLAVTTSTLNGAVRVWDLRAVKQTPTSLIDFSANCGPARILCCAREPLLAFVGNSYSAVNVLGIRQPDFFGIDVLNLADGTRRNLLSYGKYGRLLKMKVSPDGKYLALLLATVNQNSHYVAIIEVLNTGDLVALAEHKSCRIFETSTDWSWLATEATKSVISEIILWNIKNQNRKNKDISALGTYVANEEYAKFVDATCPRFLLDRERFAFISLSESCRVVKIYSLPQLQLSAEIGEGDIFDLKVLPGLRNRLLLSSFSNEGIGVVNSVWNASTSTKMTTDFVTEKRGIIDVSKDGKLALDSELNVYDLTQNGSKISSFKDCRTGETKRASRMSISCEFVNGEIAKLTYDGRFVLWTEQNQLKAGRVKDGCLVGTAYMHERLSCIDVVDAGYMQVVGGENGHIFVVRLMAVNAEANEAHLATAYNPKNLNDRLNYLLDRHASLRNAEDDKWWKLIDAFYGGGREFGSCERVCKHDSKESKCKSSSEGINIKRPRNSLLASNGTAKPKISVVTLERLKMKANIPITELGGFVKHFQIYSTQQDIKGSNQNISESGHASRNRSPLKHKFGFEKPKRSNNSSSVPASRFPTLDILVAGTLSPRTPLRHAPKK